MTVSWPLNNQIYLKTLNNALAALYKGRFLFKL